MLRDVFAFLASTSELGAEDESAWAVDLPRFKKFLMQNRILLSVAELLSRPSSSSSPDESENASAASRTTENNDQGKSTGKSLLMRSSSSRNPLGGRYATLRLAFKTTWQRPPSPPFVTLAILIFIFVLGCPCLQCTNRTKARVEYGDDGSRPSRPDACRMDIPGGGGVSVNDVVWFPCGENGCWDVLLHLKTKRAVSWRWVCFAEELGSTNSPAHHGMQLKCN